MVGVDDTSGSLSGFRCSVRKAAAGTEIPRENPIGTTYFGQCYFVQNEM